MCDDKEGWKNCKSREDKEEGSEVGKTADRAVHYFLLIYLSGRACIVHTYQ